MWIKADIPQTDQTRHSCCEVLNERPRDRPVGVRRNAPTFPGFRSACPAWLARWDVMNLSRLG